MTFAAREESRAQGAPIELYLFRFGPETEAFAAFTTAEEEVTYDGVTYAPVPITRPAVTMSGSMNKTTLEIRTSRSSPLAERFKIAPPSSVVSLVIRSGHVGEGEFIRAWGGRVLGVGRPNNNEIVLTCEPRSLSLKQIGLRRRYGYGCPLVLFGDQCRASKVASTVTKTVTSVAGSVVTLPTDWETTEMQPKYLHGTLEWITGEGFAERRTILSVGVGDGTLVLGGYPTGLLAAMSVDVVLGCDHQMTGCNVHGNIQNFGGQPWIPTENPVGAGTNQFN